jgi:hypothetical protein
VSVVHDLVEGAAVRFADRGQRTISGIADTEWVRHLVVVGDAQDGAGFILIPLRLTRSAYQQAVGLTKTFFGETALAAGLSTRSTYRRRCSVVPRRLPGSASTIRRWPG